MILDYYRIFYYVAQYKSFSKAADVMGNNQPNITRCMNILENDLGCKLFIRSNRGVQLTIEGERLFEHVSIAIEQLVSGENELLKDKGLESGLVNIGASEIALRLFLLNELEVFHHHYPHVKLRISNHSTPQAVQALENGLVDFAVVTTPVALKKPLQRVPLYSFREILIGGEEYAEIASRKHRLQDLQDIPLIGIAPGTSTRKNGWGWDNFIAEANAGTGMKFPKSLKGYVSYGIPAIIIVIYLKGYYDKFAGLGTGVLVGWMIVALVLLGFVFYCAMAKKKAK